MPCTSAVQSMLTLVLMLALCPHAVPWCHMFALVPYVCPGAICMPWCHMYALVPYVCPGAICMPWCHMCALVPYVCPSVMLTLMHSCRLWLHCGCALLTRMFPAKAWHALLAHFILLMLRLRSRAFVRRAFRMSCLALRRSPSRRAHWMRSR